MRRKAVIKDMTLCSIQGVGGFIPMQDNGDHVFGRYFVWGIHLEERRRGALSRSTCFNASSAGLLNGNVIKEFTFGSISAESPSLPHVVLQAAFEERDMR